MIIEAIRFTKKSTYMLGELRYLLPSFPLWSSSTCPCFRLLLFFLGDLSNGSLSSLLISLAICDVESKILAATDFTLSNLSFFGGLRRAKTSAITGSPLLIFGVKRAETSGSNSSSKDSLTVA